MVAIGAMRAARRCGALDVKVKWPNDLVCRDRKLAGILVEAAGGRETVSPDFVVVGIGVNVTTPPAGFPAPLDGVAVALDQLGAAADLTAGEFGAAMLNDLADVYGAFLEHGFIQLRGEWLASNATIGRRVAVSGVLESLDALASSVDGFGRLLVQLDDGRLVPVAAGDVTLRPPACRG